MRYTSARLNDRIEQKLYRTYCTDTLKAIVENTQRMNGGVTVKKRFADIVYKPRKADTPQTAAEIIAHVRGLFDEVGEED